MTNTTNTTSSWARTPVDPADLDQAREVAEAALRMYADSPAARYTDAALALAMAGNVRGWTHTTRLRDFLKGVKR